MTRTHFRLLPALVASLCLHLLALWQQTPPPPRPQPLPPLAARLTPPPPVAQPPQETLHLPDPEPAKPVAAKPMPKEKPPPPKPTEKAPAKSAPAPRNWQEAIRQQLKQQDEAGEFYPPEAIARGLQGLVVVLMILDEQGKVVASRVEQGSGHPMLDDAALRAVRRLRALPADAPRETQLPVRFRLR